jgi:hypothetical protein
MAASITYKLDVIGPYELLAGEGTGFTVRRQPTGTSTVRDHARSGQQPMAGYLL